VKITDVMTRDPVWCTPSCTALKAAALMRDSNCGTLPVVASRDEHKVVGIITDRDLCLKVVAAGRDASDVLVGECMTADPVCCNREDEVRRALLMMGTHGVRRVIVTNHQGYLQGIISLTDLLEYEVVSPQDVAYVLKQIDVPERRRTMAAIG
jgi:signal-transduction protein with cAMP-binding, CBS, and nucleotidyltransferase domain